MTPDHTQLQPDPATRMAMDPERERLARERGMNYLFIPRRLSEAGHSELGNLPLNVLFASFRTVSGIRESGQALYEPDLSTLAIDAGRQSMTYRNAYGSGSALRITYDTTSGRWHGGRLVHGKLVDEATGTEWKTFFINLGAPGLLDGEPCRFTPADGAR